MTLDFNDCVRLEVETQQPVNLLTTSQATLVPSVQLSTPNGDFSSGNVTNWAAGTADTLLYASGKGQVTKNGTVNAGELLAVYTYQIPASAGRLYIANLDFTRNTAVPVGVDMQFRLNLVAYNASNVRLGVVAGYNGTTDTTVDATLSGSGSTQTGGASYSAITPAGTSYLQVEVLAHNTWTYAGSGFVFTIDNLQVFETAWSSLTGWSVVSGCAINTDSLPQWRFVRTGGPVEIESAKVDIVAGKPMGAAVDMFLGDDTQVGIRYYDAFNNVLAVDYGQTYPTSPGRYGRPTHHSTAPDFATKAALVLKATDTGFGNVSYWRSAVLVQGDTPYEANNTDYDTTLPASASNLIMNPSGELGAQGWNDFDGNSIVTTRNALPANAASYNFQWDETSAPIEPADTEIILAQVTQGFSALYSNTTAMTAGQWVSGRAYVKARVFPGATPFIRVGWEFRNSSNAVISTSLGTQVTINANEYFLVEGPRMAAPAGTVRVRMVIQNSDVSGSFSDIKAYSWTFVKRAQMNVGATEASVTNLPMVSAQKWQNILGPTHSITIDTDEVSTGILTAEILDPYLDPAVGQELKPGLKVRLQAKVDNVWQTRFFGTTTAVSTTYDVNMTNGDLSPRITLEAVDPQAILANTPSRNTVATLSGLASQMPADVLWNINGQSSVGTNPTIVAVNDNATVLDQAIITRDTVGGYVWVDRNGVFNAWDPGAFSLYQDKIWFTDSPKPAKTGRNENLIVNPSFLVGTTGWTATGGTMTYDGVNHQALLTATGGVFSGIFTAMMPVEAGQTIGAVVVASASGSKFTRGLVNFYDASNAQLGTQLVSTSGHISGTVPANAVNARLYVAVYENSGLTPATAGTILYVNEATLVVNPTDDWNFEFFNGNEEFAYWTGTANNSTSVKDYGLWQDYLTNFDLGYNSQELINRVTVKGYGKNDDGTYDEVVVGTYEDSASIAEWGVAATEVTVADATSAATIGARILTSNSQPEVTAHNVTFLVKDEASLKRAVFADLYDQVHVKIADKFNSPVRVAGISHVLTAQVKNGVAVHRWEVTLKFKGLDTSAVISGSAPPPVGTPNVPLPVGAESSTDNIGDTATSFAAGSPQVGVSFVAPLSGIVFVTVTAHLEQNVQGNFAYCGFELRDGGTVGSGTVIVPAATDWAVGTGSSVNTSQASRISASIRRRCTGLTPGNTYNVRTMHLTTPAGSVDVFFRSVTVEPWVTG